MDLASKKVAMIVDDYFEQIEMTQTRSLLERMGASVDLISDNNTVQGLNHIDKGDRFDIDLGLNDASPEKYDAVVLPGGTINGDQLRTNQKCRDFILSMHIAGKPVAAICHAPWVFVSAGMSKDKKMTSYPSLKDDIINAGGEWVDEEVVTDGNMITSRKPDDIPAFAEAIARSLVQ